MMEINTRADGRYYFEIQTAGNYRAFATSVTFRTEAAALQAIDQIKRGAASAPIIGP